MQATVEWSYQLLDPTAQQVFDRLGAFAGPVDLAAVCAVAGDEQLDEFDVVDALTALVDHSLVIAEHDGVTSRYRLLDTMRAYARDRLTEHGQLDRLALRHAGWVAEQVTVLNEELLGTDWDAALAAVDAMEQLWPDLRAAVNFALGALSMELVARLLGGFSMEAMSREREELGEWLTLALQLPAISEHPSAASLYGVAALLSWRAGRFAEMNEQIEHAMGSYERTGVDPGGVARQACCVGLMVTGNVAQGR